jgi:hypothetical protein
MNARTDELTCAADTALLAHLARSPLADVRAVGDGQAIATGLSRNDRNGVLCTHLPEADADAQIARALGWLRARGVPGQWRLGPRPSPADLGARLLRAGCEHECSAVYHARR